jgi:hypothetical protein
MFRRTPQEALQGATMPMIQAQSHCSLNRKANMAPNRKKLALFWAALMYHTADRNYHRGLLYSSEVYVLDTPQGTFLPKREIETVKIGSGLM